MKRASTISGDSVFDDDMSRCDALTHEVLLMGCSAIQAMLGLGEWLSEDRSWSCDMDCGLLNGQVVLDDALVNVKVSALVYEQNYFGMLDARLKACDGIVIFIEDKLEKDTLNTLFQQIQQVKDGRLFSIVLALLGTEESNTLHTNALEWAEDHCGTTITCLKDLEDNASLAQCVCDLAVRVHRVKSSIAKLMHSPDSSPCPSRHSGSMRSGRSSRRNSTSSSVGCAGLRLQRSQGKRKDSISQSTTSSLASRSSKERLAASPRSAPNPSGCAIM